MAGAKQNGDRQPTEDMKPGENVSYYLQEHRTGRDPNNPHLDLRLGKPDTGLHSWAVPKGEMPEPGKKHLAVQTPIHPFGYGEFQGRMGKGMVQRADKGNALITKTTPNTVQFTLQHTDTPAHYALVRISSNQWLLINRSPKAQKADVQLVEAPDVDGAISQVQEKTAESVMDKVTARIVEKRAQVTNDVTVADIAAGKYGRKPEDVATNVTEVIGKDVTPHIKSIEEIARQEVGRQPLKTKIKLLPDLARVAVGREPKLGRKVEQYMATNTPGQISMRDIVTKYPVTNAAYTNYVRDNIVSPAITSVTGTPSKVTVQRGKVNLNE